jgi:multicomponent Na+:H+ antiporter subunit C
VIVVLALTIGVLYACGAYLMMQRSLSRIVIGLALLGHGANLLLLVAGGRSGAPPIVGVEGTMADPLPQALALTAIVITFAVSAFLLALAWRN